MQQKGPRVEPRARSHPNAAHPECAKKPLLQGQESKVLLRLANNCALQQTGRQRLEKCSGSSEVVGPIYSAAEIVLVIVK